MAESPEKRYQFNLARQSYIRTSILAWLMCGAFLLCALLGTAGGFLLWPTYLHGFTLYLKWQDALVACCWCVALVSLGGCVLMLRFLYALRGGYKQGMLILDGKNKLSGRDLSPKNFASVFWLVTTTFSCFVVMLVGLIPAVLIGWTTHLPNLVLMVFATFIAFLLSLGGLVLAAPFGAFFVIGLVGGVSFCRKLGAAQTYVLSSQTTLRIDGSVLAIIHPDKPETLFDLQLLTPEDQRQALTLLRERWLEAERPWNPEFGDEIEAALKETEHQTVSA